MGDAVVVAGPVAGQVAGPVAGPAPKPGSGSVVASRWAPKKKEYEAGACPSNARLLCVCLC